jgi:integrase
MSNVYQITHSKFLLDNELSLLLSILNKDNSRNGLILILLLKTGARASEILEIRPCDLNLESQTVLIRGLKGSDDRELPLSQSLFERLVLESKGSKLYDPIFPISYQRLDQIWAFYRPVKKKLHSLRHTFAIELYKKHRDLRLVQIALGHRNIQNTMVYAQYVYSKEELRKIL